MNPLVLRVDGTFQKWKTMKAHSPNFAWFEDKAAIFKHSSFVFAL